MTVTAPPRPPRPGAPVDREELEALVEALIEEARQRARRRRRRYGAIAVFLALVGVAVFAVFERSAQSQPASPGLAARSSLATGTADSKIAFISAPPRCEQCNVPRGDLYVMNADGSGQRLVTRNVEGMFGKAAWSPDGQKIAFSKNGISVVNVDGSGERRLTGGSPAAWSSDGQKIAFTRSHGGRFSEVYVINADGSGERRLTRDAIFPAWLPDGRIAFARVTNWRHPTFELYVMNADGSGQRNLTREWRLARLDDPRVLWSPNGQRIAFTSQRDGNQEIYVLNADGSEQRRLTHNPANDGSLAWSPDSQTIAFARSHDGRVSNIYVMNADGSEQQRLTRNPARSVQFLAWSPAQKR